jgi:D-sedoheptulose 7-phosphate isomerase
MDNIQKYIAELQSTLNELPVKQIQQVIDTLHKARLSGKQIFVMGNGGSASTASHFVCDLSKNTRHEGWPSFRVIGLADNIASLTAYGNDEGFQNIFSQQIANLIEPGDVSIGISTSGNSMNVINAIELARRVDATTVGFTGFNGGKLGSIVDINVQVKSDCIEQIEDVHLMLEHLICKTLREEAKQRSLNNDWFYTFSKEFAAQLDLRELLRRILQLTLEGVGAASGSIMVLNKEGNVVEGALAYGGKIQLQGAQQFAEVVERGLAGWVLANRQAALVTNTREDPRWLRRSWEENQLTRSAVSVPLISNDRVVGVLTLVNPEIEHFTKDDVSMLTAIAVCMSLANLAI